MSRQFLEKAAVYNHVENYLWQGNPLIEALGRLLPDLEFSEIVKHVPHVTSRERNLPNEERLVMLGRCQNLFVPFNHHVLLNQRIARVIRSGYENRNPMNNLDDEVKDQQIKSFKHSLEYEVPAHDPKPVTGFTLTGISGVGKSLSLRSVMRTYPQIIVHEKYKGTALNIKQLVWIWLQCPEDGSLKALCISFFKSVDKLFDLTYFKKHIQNARSVAEMMPHFAEIVAITNLGVLVIDEIQFINASKSQGYKVMLNFFTNLANSMDIPIILVGDPKAKEILDTELHQVRRNSGQGEMQMSGLTQTDWDRYFKALWELQFLKTHTPLTLDLSNTLYRLSKGIVGFATKIFMIAQERAITSGKEEINKDILETVAREDFRAAMIHFQRIYEVGLPDQLKNETDTQQKSTRLSKAKSTKKANNGVITSGAKAILPLPDPKMLEMAKKAITTGIPVHDVFVTGKFIKDASEFINLEPTRVGA